MEKHAVIDAQHTPPEPNTVARTAGTPGTKTAAQPDLEDSVLKRLTDSARQAAKQK